MGSKNLVLVGDSAFAEVAFAYFQQTNEYNVVGFSVEKEFCEVQNFVACLSCRLKRLRLFPT